jgi:tetratricopeptide (TPR) repeat protein
MKSARLFAVLFWSILFCQPVIQAESALDKIAQVYLDGEVDKALVQLDAYMAKHPNDSLAWTIKGNILGNLDKDAEAEQAYQSAIKIDPKAFEAICSLGILHRKRGDYDGAIGFYQKALKINPDYAQAYSSMAVIELKRNRDAEALRLAQLAYGKDKEDPIIAANLALAYHYNGKLERRDKYTRIARELGYKNMKRLAQFYNGELTIRD